MLVSDFDYPLPEELIADRPLPQRSDSRLMLVHRETGRIEHHAFRDLPDLLHRGDLLVLNRSKVIPARLIGTKRGGGARIEILLLEQRAPLVWEALAQRAIRLTTGTVVEFNLTPQPPFPPGKGGMQSTPTGSVALSGGSAPPGKGGLQSTPSAEVLEVLGEGRFIFRFDLATDWEEFLDLYGALPLPPYILKKREDLSGKERASLDALDRERYQTTFADVPGSAAAPTAGLHFDSLVLEALQQKGIVLADVLLHVGMDTFSPVTVEAVEDHKMKSEWCYCPPETAIRIQERPSWPRSSTPGPAGCSGPAGGRIIAVGTTSCRTIEGYARLKWPDGPIRTDLFLKPGDSFLATQGLLTNFHLPRSTLLMLVSAFMGNDLRREVYEVAVRERYRFYSYGDAMLVL